MSAKVRYCFALCLDNEYLIFHMLPHRVRLSDDKISRCGVLIGATRDLEQAKTLIDRTRRGSNVTFEPWFATPEEEAGLQAPTLP